MFDPEAILYEDNHLLVVNKQAGQLVPGRALLQLFKLAPQALFLRCFPILFHHEGTSLTVPPPARRARFLRRSAPRRTVPDTPRRGTVVL